MKKLLFILFASFLTNGLSQTNVSPQFSEIKDREEQVNKSRSLNSSGISSYDDKNLKLNSKKAQIKSSNRIPNEIPNLYPLAIGNRWVYLTVSAVNPYIEYGVMANEVISDSIASNGKLYYNLKEDESYYLDRVDSVDGKVYRYFEHPNLPESEYVIADLLGEVGDTLITFDPNSGGTSYLIVTSVDTFYKWGLTKYRKNFNRLTYPISYRFSLTEDISLDHSISTYIGYSVYFERTLKGCVINGIVYGDTTLTSVRNEEPPIATTFKLEQNYPNPFNPSTKISFVIGHSSYVTLEVFDILGNEIATLINEEKTAGEYEVEFNTNSVEGRNLPSGVYFYQLKSGNFIQTKKMILLK